MEVVEGIDALRAQLGPAFVVVGVFDGLHRGHAYLLDHLVAEASAAWCPADRHHVRPPPGRGPDGQGAAAPARPGRAARASRSGRGRGDGRPAFRPGAAADALRRVRRADPGARRPQRLPDDARRGVRVRAAWDADHAGRAGERDGFDVVVVPTFDLDGQEVRSSTIRDAVASGDLETAARLLGRPVTVTGSTEDAVDGRTRLEFPLPLALPPDGDYDARIDGRPVTLRIDRDAAYLAAEMPDRRVTVDARAARAALSRPGSPGPNPDPSLPPRGVPRSGRSSSQAGSPVL